MLSQSTIVDQRINDFCRQRTVQCKPCAVLINSKYNQVALKSLYIN